jgi:membrane protein implicated in regulation of membrane protease activity
MDEVFPVLAGIAVGLVVEWLGSRGFWAIFVGGVFAIAFGAMAAWVSGELAVSWVYPVIDTAQVAGATAMTVVLVRAWRRRHARRVAG